MVLLTWIGLIKFTKEPGKLFQHAASCCSNYVQSAACTNPHRPHPLMLQWLHFNGINVSTGYIHAQLHNSFVYLSKEITDFHLGFNSSEKKPAHCLFPWSLNYQTIGYFHLSSIKTNMYLSCYTKAESQMCHFLSEDGETAF